MRKLSVVEDRRMRRLLEDAEARYRNELMDDDERLEVLARIKRLRQALETDAEIVDAVHSGLERR